MSSSLTSVLTPVSSSLSFSSSRNPDSVSMILSSSSGTFNSYLFIYLGFLPILSTSLLYTSLDSVKLSTIICSILFEGFSPIIGWCSDSSNYPLFPRVVFTLFETRFRCLSCLANSISSIDGSPSSSGTLDATVDFDIDSL